MLVHPVVVVEVRRDVGALEARAIRLIERPALGTRRAVERLRAALRRLALAPVEAREMAARGERGPDDAVRVDVDAAWVDAALRHLVDLGDAGLGWVRAAVDAHDVARIVLGRAPGRVVDRARDHRVQVVLDLAVELRIDGPAGLVPRLRDLAVTVRVDDLRAPTLRSLLVARAVVLAHVEPADDRAEQLVEVQRLIRVRVELQVMRREARVDELELAGLGVVDGRLAVREVQRVILRELVARAFLAPRGLVLADLRRRPDAALAVHHRVVRVRRILHAPKVAHAPEVRRHRGRREARRDFARVVARRDRDLVSRVLDGIDDRELAVPRRRRVHRAVGVHRRVVLVGRDLVVHERVVGAPVPEREHDVALDALRPRRLRRHLAVCDPRGPVREHARAGLRAEHRERAGHRAAAHAELRAIDPRLLRRLESQVVHVAQRARDRGAELVTEVALALDVVDPHALLGQRGRNPVAARARARELAPRGRLEQREPVVAGIDLRGVGRRRRDLRGELEARVTGAAPDLVRVDEPVAAHPEVIGCVGQLRQHVAARVVGHDDLDERGLEVVRLRDHPDAGLGALAALHDAADHTLGQPRRGARGADHKRRGQHERRRGARDEAQARNAECPH